MNTVLDSLLQIREALPKEKGLVVGEFYQPHLDMPCVAGALIPKELRLEFSVDDSWDYVENNHKEFWKGGIGSGLVEENNVFEGTPEERKAHMIKCVDEQIARFGVSS